MKTIRQKAFLVLFPLLVPLAATAQDGAPSVPIPPVTTDTTVNPTTRDAEMTRASKVIGTNVKNANDETIGEIEDLIVDLKSGEVLAVVVSSGGFLGIADTLSSVPPSLLRYDVEASAFKTKLTKEQLGKAPQFEETSWPDYSESATVEKLRTFRDSIGGNVTAPDNSARNEEEMKKDGLTAMDQSGTESDMKITKEIRAAVMDADLSFGAKNIKIITKDGHVTVKGVVKNSAEHEAVLKIAKGHADASRITDELKEQGE